MIDGKNINLGSYISKDDAIKARKHAEKKYFGEYAYRIGEDNWQEKHQKNFKENQMNFLEVKLILRNLIYKKTLKKDLQKG